MFDYPAKETRRAHNAVFSEEMHKRYGHDFRARAAPTTATPTDVVFEKFVLYKSDRAEDIGSRRILRAIEPSRKIFVLLM